jgi:D-beta-D-heptose 7-phosphate kinase/D-beta-D-heptose 1-phosphate adenosyltransferase
MPFDCTPPEDFDNRRSGYFQDVSGAGPLQKSAEMGAIPNMSIRLIELVENLKAARIALIGDLMLDRYVYGQANRLSPDAPVPVLHYHHEDSRLGGAGRVAADLAALGASVRVLAVVGPDDTGAEIRKQLAQSRADTSALVETPGRPSTAKVRLVGLAQDRHPQQMMRLDYEEAAPLDGPLAARVIDGLPGLLDGADALCIEDYNKGLLTDEVCRVAIRLARQRNIPVLVDPARLRDYSKYKNATAITPNRAESELATDLPARQPDQFQACAERLLQTLELEAAVLTLDKQGAYLATADGQRRWLKTRERTVYDVAGAGDMVLSVLTLARASGADWVDAVALANVAGGLEVERFGSVPVSRDEIVAELLTEEKDRLGKVRSMDQLLPELQRHRARGKKVVFTNGCFDLIHLGHVKYFQFARGQGDLLVVGVNTDASIRRLKGNKRPIIAEEDRIGVLEELESIDYIVQFDQDTPIELIKAVRPDILVKGEDYARQTVVGRELVESYGGKVALAPLVDGRSTSAVIQRILETHAT